MSTTKGVGCILLLVACVPLCGAMAGEEDFQAAIRADWVRQEERRGRTIENPQAVADAAASAGRLLAAMSEQFDSLDLHEQRQALQRCQGQLDSAETLSAESRRELYCRIREITRGLMAKNPLMAGRPIAFVKRRRFICQVLHEYIGYYFNYDGLHGGGVFVLEEPGVSDKTRDLIAGRLPKGNYATPAVSYDGRTIYFAFTRLADVPRDRPSTGNHIGMLAAEDVPETLNYYSQNRGCFQVYAVDVDGGNLRQLTRGCEDNFSPCPMADGTVVFMSSRRGGFCRCDNPFEPMPTTTLHSMDPDGSNQRMLSYHETNEWQAAPLCDGRIAYCRWDYVDRSAAHFHGVWACNPDGSNPMALFGNYTKRVSCCFQPRSVPGSNRIVFVAGAHHADVGGSLVLLDPARVHLNEESGEDDFDCLERLTPEVPFPETPDQWPDSFYHSPWPLSEDFYLVAFSFEPLPGMNSGVLTDSKTGLYYFDRFGNMELLYRDPDISSMNAMPLDPPAAPHALPSVLDPALHGEGEFFLADVKWSTLPMPADRPIRSLRVFQILPKSETHVANRPRIGYANAEPARSLLGTVPVEEDGSAYFRVPAGKPICFQAVDDSGRAVQGMRTLTYVQPGERRSCVGCHEPSGTAPPRREAIALRRPPSVLQPGPDGTEPMSYVRLIQPVLNRSCVGCHDGAPGEGKSDLSLTGEPVDAFTRSYESLRPFIRKYEWGDGSINQTVTVPGRMGADESPLSAVLDDETHRGIELSQADRQKFFLWMDANAPFYGTYSAREQLAQQRGDSVAVPAMQ